MLEREDHLPPMIAIFGWKDMSGRFRAMDTYEGRAIFLLILSVISEEKYLCIKAH